MQRTHMWHPEYHLDKVPLIALPTPLQEPSARGTSKIKDPKQRPLYDVGLLWIWCLLLIGVVQDADRVLPTKYFTNWPKPAWKRGLSCVSHGRLRAQSSRTLGLPAQSTNHMSHGFARQPRYIPLISLL